MTSNLEQYVRQAKNGDRQALETVVCRIQDKIYGLALRMLGNPDDAEDEAQEILIKAWSIKTLPAGAIKLPVIN